MVLRALGSAIGVVATLVERVFGGLMSGISVSVIQVQDFYQLIHLHFGFRTFWVDYLHLGHSSTISLCGRLPVSEGTVGMFLQVVFLWFVLHPLVTSLRKGFSDFSF